MNQYFVTFARGLETLALEELASFLAIDATPVFAEFPSVTT
jgi:23S rRNA G2445 N2-methylase RlmL